MQCFKSLFLFIRWISLNCDFGILDSGYIVDIFGHSDIFVRIDW